jgi:hypothetical protein
MCAAALLSIAAAMTDVARAQDRPFVFSVTTAPDRSKPQVLVDYDVGVGEHTFHTDWANGPEQRVGVQASLGRWTLIGRVNLASNGGAYEASQQGEALFSVLTQRSSPVALEIGGGVLHEADGVDVLLARVVAGRESRDWRLHGNLLFQAPRAQNRDALDLISSAGWARRLTPAVWLGVEGIGEDLEGFWDPAEAEGGARLLIGPSLHISPPGRKWQLSVAGGPMLHPSRSLRSTTALRDLPPVTGGTGYAVRTSFACSF